MKHAIEIKASDVTNNRDPQQRVRYLEHVVLKLHIDHHRRGDLEIKLKSPQGTPSILLERRMYDRSTKVSNLRSPKNVVISGAIFTFSLSMSI